MESDFWLKEANEESNKIADAHIKCFEKAVMNADERTLFGSGTTEVLRFFDDEASNMERAFLHAMENARI
ncbi:MAG: hypothetical protein IPL67_17925 [Ignavibacteria bacterium]|nr:hypothetical protein [Ignavibacteria bacterium]